MTGKANPNDLDPYAKSIIQHKARQLIGKYGFNRDDLDDLQQDMALDLLVRLPKFDPSKASFRTFVSLIVNRKTASIVRSRRREKRSYRRHLVSLDEPVASRDGSVTQREQTISRDDFDRRMGKHGLSDEERVDLHIDLSLAVSELSPDLRNLAGQLVTHSISEVARERGVPRSTLYSAGIGRLRKAFEDRGLRDYL